MERYIVSNFHRGVDQPKSQFHTQLQKLFSDFFYLFKRSYMYAIQVREVIQLLHHEVFCTLCMLQDDDGRGFIFTSNEIASSSTCYSRHIYLKCVEDMKFSCEYLVDIVME